MSRKPDPTHLLALARPASLDRGSRISADDMLAMTTTEAPEELTCRPSRQRRPLVTALRFTAVATAVAVATTVLVRSTDSEVAPSPPTLARAVLLAAADRIETANPATGRYWHATGQSFAVGAWGQSPVGKEPEMIRYRVACTHETWMARSERDASWLVVTAQSGEPLTRVDEAAWRRQGAYRLGACEGPAVPSVGGALPAPPFATRLDDKHNPEVSYPQVGATHVTTEEVMSLPTDPAKLEEVLQAWNRRGGYRSTEESLFSQATTILSQLPTTPKLRAALYRVLANLQSVENTGTIKDPLGRVGAGIELSGSGRQIIIDQTSGGLLAVQERSPDGTGELTAWTALTTSGWTDARPALPKTQL
ncbi:CU044_5270 family protein [Microtetraspora malaysiensis]|uniref:CU044_5270 family protein n=1 Tax=Microtetraspora malaysiensis TaxID=161358 RepID=UPI000A6DD7FB|nr:CU044_5270 family protein [Microtetraspora malaysiensis]